MSRSAVQCGGAGPVQHLPHHPAQLPPAAAGQPQHVLQQADLRPLRRPRQHVRPALPRPQQQLPAQPARHGLAHHAQAGHHIY